MVEKAPEVSSEDLQSKWDEITSAVRRQTERKVMGVSVLAVGGIVLGVGAVGVAYWLGRRSARHHQPEARLQRVEPSAAVQAAPAATRDRPSMLARTLEPALDSAVDSVVNAAVKSAVNALTNRLRSDRQQQD